jgi:hypothetical protein
MSAAPGIAIFVRHSPDCKYKGTNTPTDANAGSILAQSGKVDRALHDHCYFLCDAQRRVSTMRNGVGKPVRKTPTLNRNTCENQFSSSTI